MSGGIFQVFRWPRFKLRQTGAYIHNLFAAGEQGGIWRIAPETCYQDINGTIPGVVGQPVGYVADLSGNGLHYKAGLNDQRPTLRQDSAGHYYLDTEGGTKRMAASAVNLSGTDKFTLVIGINKTGDSVAGSPWGFGSGAGTFRIAAPADAGVGNFRFELTGTDGSAAWRAINYPAPVRCVVSCKFDLAGADRTSEIIPRINGLTPTLTAAGIGSAGGGMLANSVIYLGGTGVAGTNFTGHIYSHVGIGRILSTRELEICERWVSQQTMSPPEMAVFINRTAGSVHFHLPAKSTPSNEYIEYRLFHHVAADADVWTIAGVWESRLSNLGVFTRGKRLIIEQTELLCALQEQGQPDFMGGYAHGDEAVTAAPTLTIDGNAVSLATGGDAWYYGAEAVFSQTSRLYRYGSALSVPLAERQASMTFNATGLTTNQKITHLTGYTLQNGYLAMMAPHRYEVFASGVSEDATSAQISGVLIDNVRGMPIDCAARAESSGSDFAQTTPRISKVTLSGTYGYSFSVEVTSTDTSVLKDVHFLQRNQYAYNKAYIGFVGGYSGVQSVTNGQEWNISTLHRVWKPVEP